MAIEGILVNTIEELANTELIFPKEEVKNNGKRPVRLFAPIPLAKVNLHRNHACKSYNTCLIHAASKGWTSFTCSECGYFMK